jgi:hypothetical protein
MQGNKEDGGNREKTSLLSLLPPVQISFFLFKRSRGNTTSQAKMKALAEH